MKAQTLVNTTRIKTLTLRPFLSCTSAQTPRPNPTPPLSLTLTPIPTFGGFKVGRGGPAAPLRVSYQVGVFQQRKNGRPKGRPEPIRHRVRCCPLGLPHGHTDTRLQRITHAVFSPAYVRVRTWIRRVGTRCGTTTRTNCRGEIVLTFQFHAACVSSGAVCQYMGDQLPGLLRVSATPTFQARSTWN